MRISDWSSDVCSSDLLPQLRLLLPPLPVRRPARVRRQRAAHHGDAAPGYLPACRLAALSRARLPEQRNLDGDHHGRVDRAVSAGRRRLHRSAGALPPPWRQLLRLAVAQRHCPGFRSACALPPRRPPHPPAPPPAPLPPPPP